MVSFPHAENYAQALYWIISPSRGEKKQFFETLYRDKHADEIK